MRFINSSSYLNPFIPKMQQFTQVRSGEVTKIYQGVVEQTVKLDAPTFWLRAVFYNATLYKSCETLETDMGTWKTNGFHSMEE